MSSDVDAGGVTTASSRNLNVGVDGAPVLPAQDIVTGRGLIAGVSGSGKSNTATVIAEEILNLGVPVVIIDPEGEFVALRDEYPVVCFGADIDADVTGDPGDARELAHRAVAERVPVVFDLSGFPEESGDLIAAAIADGLFRAELDAEIPMLLIVDEIDEYLPVKVKTATSKPLTRVAQRGRKRGLGLLGVSQRPADVSKDFVTQAEHHIWHRLTWENDTDVAKKHLPTGYADRLEELDDGEVVLGASWSDSPQRFFMRFKRVADLGSTPSIERSIGSVPDRVPDDLLHVEQTDGGEPSERCSDCPFCSAGIQPPAHLAAAVSADEGDVLGVYQVQQLSDNTYRVGMREKFLADLGLEAGDTVGVGPEDGVVRLFLDGGGGLVHHTVGDGPRLTLNGRALDFLATDVEDHVRVVDRDGTIVLERVTDRADALEYPVVGYNEPYCKKSHGDKADGVTMPKSVVDYIGAEERVGVRHQEGNVYLVAGTDGVDTSYVVQRGIVGVGAQGIRPLGASEGDTIYAVPDGPDRARLEVRR